MYFVVEKNDKRSLLLHILKDENIPDRTGLYADQNMVPIK